MISSHLDLRSLVQLSSTCRFLRDLCLHPSQFVSLNLQPYWNGVNDASIEEFFRARCVQTRYLSLAWSQSIGTSSFTALMETCADRLLHLNLNCCQYLTGEHIKAIAHHCLNLRVLSLENCISLSNLDFLPLKSLEHIRSLNVYRTHIDYRTLLPLINSNRQHLERINLGKRRNVLDREFHFTMRSELSCHFFYLILGKRGWTHPMTSWFPSRWSLLIFNPISYSSRECR